MIITSDHSNAQVYGNRISVTGIVTGTQSSNHDAQPRAYQHQHAWPGCPAGVPVLLLSTTAVFDSGAMQLADACAEDRNQGNELSLSISIC